jgi:hypothetical protein
MTPNHSLTPTPKTAGLSWAKLRAQKANAAKSAAARSPEAQKTCSMNALKHAGRSEVRHALPGEDQAELDEHVADYVRDLKAGTRVERDLATDIAHCSWRIRRCRRAADAGTTRRMHQADQCFENVQAQRVQQLIDELPCQPAATMLRLCARSQGLEWVCEQLRQIDERLTHFTSVRSSQRDRLVHLMGKSPTLLCEDVALGQFYRAYVASLFGDKGTTAEYVATKTLAHCRPETMSFSEFERAMELLLKDLPSVAEGRAALRQTIEDMLVPLVARYEEVVEYETRDRSLTLEEAMVDTTPEGQKLDNYLARHWNARNTAMQRLEQTQKQRLLEERSGAGGPKAGSNVANDATARATDQTNPDGRDRAEPPGAGSGSGPGVEPQLANDATAKTADQAGRSDGGRGPGPGGEPDPKGGPGLANDATVKTADQAGRSDGGRGPGPGGKPDSKGEPGLANDATAIWSVESGRSDEGQQAGSRPDQTPSGEPGRPGPRASPPNRLIVSLVPGPHR